MGTARGQDAKGQGKKKETHCNTLQHTAKCVCVCGGYGGCELLEAKIESGNEGRQKNALHHTATRCYTLQHTATHCNTLLNAFVRVTGMEDCDLLCVAVCGIVYCSVLQCDALCCIVLHRRKDADWWYDFHSETTTKKIDFPPSPP